jgi:hypothetical protein
MIKFFRVHTEPRSPDDRPAAPRFQEAYAPERPWRRGLKQRGQDRDVLAGAEVIGPL